MIDKYTWVDKGSSYLMSDINAAVLTAQLEHAPVTQDRRSSTFTIYMEALSGWAHSISAELPHHLHKKERPFHLFPILMPSLYSRTQLIEHAKNQGVNLTFHYVPLHTSPGGLRYGRCQDDFSLTNQISDTIVRLPLYSDLTNDAIEKVIETLLDFKI